MKQITDFLVKHIISEPGDFTRYDYIVIERFDEYIIAPFVSTFPFPTRLLYWDICEISTLEQCVEFIKRDDRLSKVNPHTMLEVITTVKEIHKDKFKIN